MPSERFAGLIKDSLAKGENFEDFAYLFDTMISLRRSVENSENIVGRLLCVVFPDKPKKYVRAMQEFRLEFKGAAGSRELQQEFINCLRPAVFFIQQISEIVWRPSLYFSPRTRGGHISDWF